MTFLGPLDLVMHEELPLEQAVLAHQKMEAGGRPEMTSQAESDAPGSQDSVTGGAGGPAVSHA